MSESEPCIVCGKVPQFACDSSRKLGVHCGSPVGLMTACCRAVCEMENLQDLVLGDGA